MPMSVIWSDFTHDENVISLIYQTANMYVGICAPIHIYVIIKFKEMRGTRHL